MNMQLQQQMNVHTKFQYLFTFYYRSCTYLSTYEFSGWGHSLLTHTHYVLIHM